MKYLGIGLTSAAFAFFLSLSTGLLDAGIRAHGDDQAVITALGGTTFGINILFGIIAMIVVAVLSFKRRGDEAGQPNQGIVTLNALLASVVGGGIGSSLSYVLWPMHVQMLVGTGVFPHDPLSGSLPINAVTSSFGGVALTGLIAGAIGAKAGARRAGKRANVSAAQAAQAGHVAQAGQIARPEPIETEPPSRMGWRIFSVFLGLSTIAGASSIYRVIANAQPTGSEDAYTIYFAMGAMLCLAAAFLGGILVHTIGAVLAMLMGNGDLVNNTISRVTRAGSLVLPLGLLAASTGIMSMWVTKMIQKFGVGQADTVTPIEAIKIFSGPIGILIVALISIVLASAGSGRRVNSNAVWSTVLIDAVAYLTISTTIAYSLMIINEVITSAVLRNGPLPDFPTTLPDWRAFAVVLGGVGIRMIIVWARSRRESAVSAGMGLGDVVGGDMTAGRVEVGNEIRSESGGVRLMR